MFTQPPRRRKPGLRMRRFSSVGVRLGIALSPTACRIVEIDRLPPWRRPPAATRVRSFAVLAADGAETEAHLTSLQHGTAAVVVWGASSDHRRVIVTDRSYERMRDEALAALAS